MHVLVYPHDLEIGGSQINAVDLAAAVAGAGHEVTIFGVPGPLNDRIEELGLAFREAPRPGRRPSAVVARALVDEVRARRFDLVHAYEWPPSMEALLGPGLALGTPVVSTVMSMGVADFLPRTLPLIVGTRQIERVCLAARRSNVRLLEPPIDTRENAPGSVPTGEFRSRWGLTPEDFNIVVVSRLAQELKREGLLEAVAAVGQLARGERVRLLIVGAGPARAELEAAAASVNDTLGRDVVTLTGALMDPRPAYESADVVLGMGSSALRGMAFAKPLVVQGEAGFWSLLTPETLPTFLEQGWYGIGPGGGGAERLTSALRTLHTDASLRRGLGDFARRVVCERFGLDAALQVQLASYANVLARPKHRVPAADLSRSLARLLTYKVKRKAERRAGTVAADDFNARSHQSLLAGPA